MSDIIAVTRQETRKARLLEYANTKRNIGDFNNVTIKAGAETILANRMVLACYSKFFETMFLSQFNERYQNTIELKTVDGAAIKTVIDFIYSGMVDLNAENVLTLLGAADFLQVDDLKSICFDFLESLLTIHNCLDIVKASIFYNDPSSPLQRTYRLISDNFDEIAQGNKFKELFGQELVFLLANINRPSVPETSVYTAIINWVKHDPSREAEFPSLFLSLDLRKLSTEFVQHKIGEEPLVKNSKSCRDAVVSYFTYLWQQPSQILCSGGNFNKNTGLLLMYSSLDKWQNHYPKLPNTLSNHRMLKLDDYIYCIGGTTGWDFRSPSNKVYQLLSKVGDSEWEEIAPMNELRSNFGAATWNGNLVVSGGCSCSYRHTTSVELYEPHINKWRRIASMNESRSGHELVVADNKLFAIGGVNDDPDYVSLSSAERLDSVDGRWKIIKSMNEGRRSFAAVSCNDFIYAIGGYFPEVIFQSVEKYDLCKDEWIFIACMSVERHYHKACVLQGKVYVIGGKKDGFENVKIMECYDPTTNHWNSFGETEEELYSHAIVAV